MEMIPFWDIFVKLNKKITLENGNGDSEPYLLVRAIKACTFKNKDYFHTA